ncbi:MAG: RNA polymerase sigma factor [Polyangiales bacterium]
MKAPPQSLRLPMATHDDTRGAARGPHLAPASFAQIYAEHADFVWRNARRLGVPVSSAEDVLQDVFITVQRRRADFDGRVPMRSWIFGILVHVVQHYRRTYQRKDARCVSLDLDVVGDRADDASGSSPHEQAEKAERVRLLEKLLGQLDEDKRTLLVLSELEGWTLREIAEHMGSNTNTVHSRLRAAKRACEALHRRWLAERGEVR